MLLYEYELGKAADVLARELLKLRAGEEVVITADTESNEAVVNAAARAVCALDAKPIVIWMASPRGVAKAADPDLPVNTLTAALTKADVWLEFNNKWLLYSTPFDVAMEKNEKLRHMNLVGMNPSMMVRCIGRIDYRRLKDFLRAVSETTKQAKHLRLTTPGGEELEFENNPAHPMTWFPGYADKPGSYMLAGQIGWAPEYKTINGTIVFDGSLVPPCGLLEEPIKLTVRHGQVTAIEGGSQAREFERWLQSFDDPQMFRLAHVCYGFNPGARLSGDIVEDERIWGATEWGLGNVGASLLPTGGINAKSHCDGICLNTSVWLDDHQILDCGKVIDKRLAKLANTLQL